MIAQIVFLNGTSSSGKSAIAKGLQMRLPAPFMIASIDQFFHFYPDKFLDVTTTDAPTLEKIASTTISGFHRCLRVLFEAGNNLIVDHVLQDQSWLRDCVVRLDGLPVLFVGVRCPLAVAEEREVSRQDRERGTARLQYDFVHRHASYDIEVDTSVMDVNACVEKIAVALEEAVPPVALMQMVARYVSK